MTLFDFAGHYWADLWIDDPVAARDTGKRRDARARRNDPRVETQAWMTAAREAREPACFSCLFGLSGLFG